MRKNVARAQIVLLGGTARPGSSTERALKLIERLFRERGAGTVMFAGSELGALPLYVPKPEREMAAARLLDAIREADGVVIGSPGYHGGISGLVKNAIDYTEELRSDERPYLAGRAVGCVVTAAGWQGGVNTLRAMRDVVHSLRGWPTPIGIAINSSEPIFDAQGNCLSPIVTSQMEIMVEEVLAFARGRGLREAEPERAGVEA